MNIETARTFFTYGIATLILVGAFALIYQGRGDSAQAWLAIGSVLGFVLRDAGGAAATGQLLRVQAAQPTTTVTSGPPATATVTPGPTDG